MKARKPTKGLRIKLRTELRKLGVTGKFRTEETRDHRLLVIANTDLVLPINEFEGRRVVFVLCPL
jgi:hypothetical protein